MGVYLYTNSTSLDLRGKTLAEVQAEGWDITSWNGSYTLDGSGLSTASSGNNGVQLYKQFPESLTSSNIITLNLTGYASRVETKYCSLLATEIIETYGNQWNGLYGIVNTGTIGGVTSIAYGGLSNGIATDGPHTTAGDFEITTVVNLSTGVVSYTLTGAMSHTATATLTSAQINSILTYGYMGFYAGIYNNSGVATLKTVYCKVE